MNVIWSVIFRVHKWTFVGTWPATSVVHALQRLPQHQGRVETQTVKNMTSNYWQSWVSHTCWSSPKEKEKTCLGVYDHECLIRKGFFCFWPCWAHVESQFPNQRDNHWTLREIPESLFLFFSFKALYFGECFSHLWVVYPQLHTMMEVNRVGCAAWLSGRESPAWATLGCWVNEMIH